MAERRFHLTFLRADAYILSIKSERKEPWGDECALPVRVEQIPITQVNVQISYFKYFLLQAFKESREEEKLTDKRETFLFFLVLTAALVDSHSSCSAS